MASLKGLGYSGGMDIAQLKAFPLFAELPDAALSHIARGATPLAFPRGALICRKGEFIQGFYCVLEGVVKLAFLSPEGHEKIVDLVHGGSSFGEALMFLDRPCPLYAQALTRCQLIHVRKEAILPALDRYSSLARQMLAGLSRRLHQLVLDLESYCMQPAAQRIIGYLLREAETHEGQTREVTFPVSKALIASRLNVTPETLSRTLSCLSEQGLLKVEGKRILIHDVERLRDLGPR
ncbi:MAG: Crp/Fnr family transcriptional regulator [Gammaproteobacteria bacterium]|nr:MAG: Crp/Fnr family transcriptional regulator [Gammaproteobacteria bacterium]